MNTIMQNYISKTTTIEWKPLIEEGLDNIGIFVKQIRFDEDKQRYPTIILKFEPGAKYPYHDHPAGEEIFMLKGSCWVEGTLLKEGDYLYTPPGFKHAVKTDEGFEALFIIPQKVEIVK
ncbi:MAG: cupin domain-containing protein [Bacteroidetes bacterium]|nr:cupin domain-containing protein [Bacteroidota bacterium]MBS1670015.1 cupin domain-containing protein [Bacteroidota bacterium]